MDENLHDIEDLFYNTLNDIEDTPSENVWDAVDRHLDKQSVIIIKRKYSNLKRIALLLLLVSVSFAIYDLYKPNRAYHNKQLTEDNGAGNSSNQKKPVEITKKPFKGDTETNIVTTKKTITADTDNKEKNILSDLDTDNKITITKNQAGYTNIISLQKQSIPEVALTEKDITTKQSPITSKQKKKLSTKQSYKVKITNAEIAEDENKLVNKDVEQLNNQIPLLRKLNTAQIEMLKWEQKNHSNVKKILPSTTASKVNATGTSKMTVAKNIQKKQGLGKASAFSITPFFSPDIAWYRLQDDKAENQSNRADNARETEKHEKHEFSSTFGVLVDYKLSKHWGLQSGLALSNINITVQPQTIYAQHDNTGGIKYRINSSSGYGYVLPSYIANPAVGDSLYAFTSSHSLQYVSIPLAATYQITKGRLSFNAMAGLSMNILTSAKLETSVENGFDNSSETVNKVQGLRNRYLSGTTGIGVGYKLSKSASLVFTPVFRFALNSINKESSVKSYPMSLGLTVGLKIAL